MTYLICYDISENKIRQRIVKYLEAFAYRHQCSVFSCKCSAAKMENIKQVLCKMLEEAEEPRLLITPICYDCEQKMWKVGKPKEEEQSFVVV